MKKMQQRRKNADENQVSISCNTLKLNLFYIDYKIDNIVTTRELLYNKRNKIYMKTFYLQNVCHIHVPSCKELPGGNVSARFFLDRNSFCVLSSFLNSILFLGSIKFEFIDFLGPLLNSQLFK